MCIDVIHGLPKILIQHSYITDCGSCDEICFLNTELNVSLFQKKIKKKRKEEEEERESYQLVCLSIQVKKDKYIHVYRAY